MQRVQCVAAFVAFVVCADLHVLSSTKRQVGAGEIMWDRIGAVEDSRSRLCWPWFRLSYGFKQSHQNPFIPSCILILVYIITIYYCSQYIYIYSILFGLFLVNDLRGEHLISLSWDGISVSGFESRQLDQTYVLTWRVVSPSSSCAKWLSNSTLFSVGEVDNDSTWFNRFEGGFHRS